MKTLLVFTAIVALAFTGCASTMTVNQQAVTVGGRTVHYVFAESTNETGMNFAVADRYDERGALIARDAAHNNGIMQAVVPAVITGAATAGGLIGAAAVLRPDMTTVNQTSGGATSTSGGAVSSATGGGATSSSTAAATAASNYGAVTAKDPMPAITPAPNTTPTPTTPKTPSTPTPSKVDGFPTSTTPTGDLKM